jgi:hypothetical protein
LDQGRGEDAERVAHLFLPSALLVTVGAHLLAPFMIIDLGLSPFFQ